MTPGALGSAVHHLPTLHTCRNTQTTFAHNHLSAYESIHSAVLACTHILAHINLLIFKQSVIHFLPENASASQTVRNVVKMDCIQMLRSLLRLVGCLPMYFPIAVLYQAGKLAHWEVGVLGCLYSGKCSSYSIHDGDRNRLWPQETFIRDCYEEQVWKKSLYVVKIENKTKCWVNNVNYGCTSPANCLKKF